MKLFNLIKSKLKKDGGKEPNKKIKTNKKTNNLSLLESDLIKGQVSVKFDSKKHLYSFLFLSLVSAIFIGEAYYIISLWEGRMELENSYYLQLELDNIESRKESLERDYSFIFDVDRRLNSSFSMLDSHVYWNNLFALLEKNTLKQVYFERFAGDINGSYVLPTITNDIRAISFQSRQFLGDSNVMSATTENEEIGEDGMGVDSGYISFDTNLELNPSIFNNFNYE